MAPLKHGVTELIGRDDEVTVLRAWWRAAPREGGRVVVVTGEPGIGKSALLLACLAGAEQDGLAVALSQCWEGGGSPPYWPWSELLPSIGIPLTGALRPIVEGVQTGCERPLTPDPSSRLLMFDAVVDALAERSSQVPVLLAMDDVHAADEASLELLRFVAPRMAEVAGLLVVTHRTSEASAEAEHALAEVAKTSEALHLSSLASAAAAVLARQLSAGAVPTHNLARIVAASEGNPFFLRELVRWYHGDPDRAGFPLAVKASIRARLQRLAPATQRVLRAAAVLGREFWLDDVVRMLTTTESEVDVALGEGIAAGMLEMQGGQRVRFAHALFAEVLLGDLAPATRSRLHADAGHALEARLARHPAAEGLSQLARHFLSAPRHLASTKGVRYGLLAAGDAEGRLAFEHAMRLYAQIRQVATEGDGWLEAEIGLGLGTCLWKLSRWEEARVEFRRAYAAAERGCDVNLQARAALGFAGQHESGPLSSEGIALLEAALALEDLPDTVVAALLARLAHALGWAGDLERANRLADRAVVLARDSGDEGLFVFALRGRQSALCDPDRVHERLATARDMVRRTTAGLPDQEIFARGWEVSSSMIAGRLLEAEAALRDFQLVAERLQEPVHLWCVAAWGGSLAAARGDFGAARSAADDALATGGISYLCRYYHTLQLLPIYRAWDRTDELIPDLEALARGRSEPVWQLSYALCLAEGGGRNKAIALLNRFLDETFPALVRDQYWILALALTGMLGVTLGSERAARVARTALAPYPERPVTEEAGFMVLDTVAAVLGELDLLLGEPKAAAEQFADGAEMARRNLMLPALARCLLGRARALSLLNDSADSVHAATEARDIAVELGMPRLLRDAEGVLSAASSRDPFCTLTASEERVVSLVAEGLTNPEIAKRLYVSSRTVQTHLYNVFAKLKVSTRAELAARAVRRNQPSGL